jgi:hypothetical protein
MQEKAAEAGGTLGGMFWTTIAAWQAPLQPQAKSENQAMALNLNASRQNCKRLFELVPATSGDILHYPCKPLVPPGTDFRRVTVVLFFHPTLWRDQPARVQDRRSALVRGLAPGPSRQPSRR